MITRLSYAIIMLFVFTLYTIQARKYHNYEYNKHKWQLRLYCFIIVVIAFVNVYVEFVIHNAVSNYIYKLRSH